MKESSDSDIIVANEKLKSVIDELRKIWESDIIQTIEGSKLPLLKIQQCEGGRKHVI